MSALDVDLEQQYPPTLDTAQAPPPPPQQHKSPTAREVLRHFLHPNGKRVHVAHSPEEAARLRNDLQRDAAAANEEFDVVLSGTREHLETLRDAQNHHQSRREELRERHQDVYDHITNVNTNLAAIAEELNRVSTTQSVNLEAHFGRFGYDAHVRSYDDGEGSLSATRSIGEGSMAYERGFATTLKLFKTPVVRQYFHKGILWRASGAEEVQSFELFIDLLFVGIIAVIGDVTAEDPTGVSLLRFIITFTLSWKIWNDMALFISWFETDDVFQRVSVLFLLTCLFGYTTNITHAFEEEESTYATLVGFYLAARLFMASYLLLISWLVPMVRSVMIYHTATILVAAALWIGSIHVEYPNQLALIWIALFIELTGSVGHVIIKALLASVVPSTSQWFDKRFEFYPAINIEHRTERTNAFVTLVFGYTVVAILFQSVTNGIDAFFGKAILGLIQAFVFNWLYFEVDGSNLSKHAIRRHKLSAFAWSMAHLPFIMAFVLAGGALARLVVAHDCPDTGIARLTEAYQDRSEGEIPSGIRWFYSAGLGTALLMMGVISLSHVHKDVEGLRLPKKFRLGARAAVAVVLILLPLAERLNSLELVGVVTALIVALLVLELWATSSCYERVVGRANPCKYVGRMGRREVVRLARDEKGGVDVDQLEVDEEKDSGTTIFA